MQLSSVVICYFIPDTRAGPDTYRRDYKHFVLAETVKIVIRNGRIQIYTNEHFNAFYYTYI